MVADKNSSYANSQVDVSAVTIAVTKPGGGALPVSSVKVSNQFYGVPNHVQWKVSGLQDNVTYDVTVGNLKYKGKTYSFPYTFRLVP
jgi:hypothetical protein